MAPLIISGVSALANTILDRLNEPKATPPAAEQGPRIEFDSLMKSRSLSGALQVQPSQLSDLSGVLMQQLMQTPEVASALGGQNLPPGSQLQFNADGGLGLHRADGFTQAINLRPETRVLVANLRASMAGGIA